MKHDSDNDDDSPSACGTADCTSRVLRQQPACAVAVEDAKPSRLNATPPLSCASCEYSSSTSKWCMLREPALRATAARRTKKQKTVINSVTAVVCCLLSLSTCLKAHQRGCSCRTDLKRERCPPPHITPTHQRARNMTYTHSGCGTIIDRPLAAFRCRPGSALALACKEKGATKPCAATANNKQPRHDLVTRPTGIVSGSSLYRERHGSRICGEKEAGDQRDVALLDASQPRTNCFLLSAQAMGGSYKEL